MVLEHEAYWRLGIFVLLLALLAGVEHLWPCRTLLVSRRLRWKNNFALLGFYTIVLRLIFPLALSGLAFLCQKHHIGLFNVYAENIPVWLRAGLSLLVLDMAIYWQHRLMHQVGSLWKLHRVHHSDADLDVSTAVRFHPIEIFVSMAIKIAVVALLGVSPVMVIVFEIILNSFALFGHTNIHLQTKLDTLLRLVFVTPNMHRIHHSNLYPEHNSNYGFSLSIWDRCFGSYTRHASVDNADITIGLPEFSAQSVQLEKNERIAGLLKMPFRKGG